MVGVHNYDIRSDGIKGLLGSKRWGSKCGWDKGVSLMGLEVVVLNGVVKVRGMVGIEKFILWLFYVNSSFFHFNEDTLMFTL